jgi:MFS family permease
MERLNVILNKMGHDSVNELPPPSEEAKKKPSVRLLFVEGRAEGTIKLWTAFFLGFATLYYLTTWIPNMASRTGLSLEMAIYAGTIFNLGAIFGNISQGLTSQIIGLRKAIVLFYSATAAFMVIFGYVSGDYMILIIFGLIGFGVQGGLIGLWTVGAKIYPTEIRNTGLGWAAGLGRTGAIISPALGGFLAGAGFSLATLLIFFAIPLIIACVAIWMVKNDALDEKSGSAAAH